MSKKLATAKTIVANDDSQLTNYKGIGIENYPGCPDDMRSGVYMADFYVKSLMDKVDEAITVIETVKKIPDYNSNLSVELAMTCASMQGFASDPRLDEKYLL